MVLVYVILVTYVLYFVVMNDAWYLVMHSTTGCWCVRGHRLTGQDGRVIIDVVVCCGAHVTSWP